MLKRTVVFFCVFAIFGNQCVFAQQPGSGESHKYRNLLTIVGGAGGATIGLFAGLSAFDDSRNSERKVTTTAILSGAGGVVGGYFLGRALDKRKKNQTVTGWQRRQDFQMQPVRNAYPSVESLGIVRPIPKVGMSRQ